MKIWVAQLKSETKTMATNQRLTDGRTMAMGPVLERRTRSNAEACAEFWRLTPLEILSDDSFSQYQYHGSDMAYPQYVEDDTMEGADQKKERSFHLLQRYMTTPFYSVFGIHG